MGNIIFKYPITFIILRYMLNFNLDHKKMGALIAIIVLICSTGLSYLVLDHYYGNGGSDTSGPGVQSEQSVPSGDSDGQVNILPLSSAIGVGMLAVTILAWNGSKKISSSMIQSQGNAASLLLNQGLENMTVRDVRIVGKMIDKRQFTIPHLLNDTQVSRSSVWKLVKKMVEKGLVEETGQKRLPDSGRGKPSKVYRYVGP